MDVQEPATMGLTAERTRAVISTAGLAPSLHNTQPWRFHVTPTSITVLADRERRLPQADAEDRELRIACGAALFTLRLALHGEGIRPLVTVFPPGADPDVIAVVRHGGRRPISPELARLLDAVPRRHTNRTPFAEAPVTRPEQHLLHHAAQTEHSWLYLVEDPVERVRLREMAVSAHREQIADPAFRDELERWTALDPGSPDGVPRSAGGPLPSPTTGWVHRDFTGGAAAGPVEDHHRQDEPLLAVLTCQLSGRQAEVHAGQALQRVLLTATANGLGVSFLSQIVEVERTRIALRRLIRSTRAPQVVMRIGHGYPVGATPRRDVADLFIPPPAQPSPHTPTGAAR